MDDPRAVLVVDDCEDDRFIARRRLTRRWPGVTIIEAVDGLSAIKRLQAEGPKPDLIFLDVHMPRMDGHDFLARRQEQGSNQIPVVVMLTCSDQADDIRRARLHTCVKHFFIKPLTDNDLTAALDGVSDTDRDV